MCCFSQPVISVSATQIFARSASGPRQFLVYSMALEAKEDLAMVLPLPVKPDTGEDGVLFIDLKEYPEFFDDLLAGFPPQRSFSFGCASKSAEIAPASALEVHQVGEFEASFVPTLQDFSRLDERFRIPPKSWNQLPGYKSYGFAVFKLKAGAQTVHPMAFSFPRNDASKLFFPTVHIHDGEVHAKADFDHVLYAQRRPPESLDFRGWRESNRPAKNFMQSKKARGIISDEEHCYRVTLVGSLPNKDTWLGSRV